jgi:hypothetical protein
VSLQAVAPQYAGKIKFLVSGPLTSRDGPVNRETCAEYGVRGFPTTIMFKDGMMVGTPEVGGRGTDALVAWINTNSQAPPLTWPDALLGSWSAEGFVFTFKPGLATVKNTQTGETIGPIKLVQAQGDQWTLGYKGQRQVWTISGDATGTISLQVPGTFDQPTTATRVTAQWPTGLLGAWNAANFTFTFSATGITVKNTQTGETIGPVRLVSVDGNQYTVTYQGQTQVWSIIVNSATSVSLQIPGTFDQPETATKAAGN